MTSLEKKLAEYRAKKNETTDNHKIGKDNETSNKSSLLHFFYKNKHNESKEKLIDEPQNEIIKNWDDSTEELDVDDSITCCSYMDIVFYTLCVMLWATFWAIFIKLQFGAVYFILSLLIGVFFNTRTRPKNKGEVSAYSVFNKNCESIDGTLKAEQFEREIRYGPLR